MKRFAIALALTCVLSGTALAGDIPSTDAKSQAPSPTVVVVVLTIISLIRR